MGDCGSGQGKFGQCSWCKDAVERWLDDSHEGSNPYNWKACSFHKNEQFCTEKKAFDHNRKCCDENGYNNNKSVCDRVQPFVDAELSWESFNSFNSIVQINKLKPEQPGGRKPMRGERAPEHEVTKVDSFNRWTAHNYNENNPFSQGVKRGLDIYYK